MNRWEVLIDLINENEYRRIAEIGVHKGKTARHIIESCILDEYILVDPIICETLNGDVSLINGYCDIKVSYLITTSEMASLLHDDSRALDLVFIDALHDYKNVKRDIGYWLKHIRPGGIICGDDYDSPKAPGVKIAVDEAFGDRVELRPVGVKGVKVWIVRV